MLKLAFKNLWARRRVNGWLFVELIAVTFVGWLLIDPVAVEIWAVSYTHLRAHET